ncbi:MAG: histone-like protein [Thermoplasmata archaeon]
MVPHKTVKRMMKECLGETHVTDDAICALQEGLNMIVRMLCTNALELHRENNALREIQRLRTRKRLSGDVVLRTLERYLEGYSDSDEATDPRGQNEEAEQ